jgi:hypothetical protein
MLDGQNPAFNEEISLVAARFSRLEERPPEVDETFSTFDEGNLEIDG